MYICKGKSCTYGILENDSFFLDYYSVSNSVSMQCDNYISDVYNKPNRLKIGWFVIIVIIYYKCYKYMHHYQHNVMSELTVATWPPVRTFDSIGQQHGRDI